MPLKACFRFPPFQRFTFCDTLRLSRLGGRFGLSCFYHGFFFSIFPLPSPFLGRLLDQYPKIECVAVLIFDGSPIFFGRPFSSSLPVLSRCVV